MKIWKYALPAPEKQISIVNMPAGAEIITLMGLNLVAIVNTDAPMQAYTFRVVKTDEEFNPEGTKYVGSYMIKTESAHPVSTDVKKGTKDVFVAFHIFQVL